MSHGVDSTGRGKSSFRRTLNFGWLIGVALTLGCSQPAAETSSGAPNDEYRAEVERFRAEREASLKSDEGWLSVAGLFTLEEGAWKMGSADGNDIVLPGDAAPPLVGTVERSRDRVFVTLAEGVTPKLNDEPAPEAFELRSAEANPERPADQLRLGRLTLFLHRSGPRLALRLRDPEGPVMRSFTGMRWFPIDARYRIEARFTEYAAPRQVPGVNILGDPISMESPGEAELTIDGRAVRLQAWDDNGRVWFVFRDRLAGSETYGIRELYADSPQDGRLLLDFNRSYNAPCAYNPYTTCPTPPSQNVLSDLAIPAGERLYEGKPLSSGN
ncbi:MAG: DUF1684 domain-containing protein [Luteitalea sp.]|nr:DUF1684 domain-containing protein [Luteitalea sp.]